MDTPTLALDLDRSHEVPLHRQIAVQLRYRIARGEIEPGAPLPSLRSAAEQWGIHLHTVRRAYGDLAEEGLVEITPKSGTRVAPRARHRSGDPDGFQAFLREVRATAVHRYGASVGRVIDGLRLLPEEPEEPEGPVWVVECSPALAGGLASQVRERWAVDARPWTVDRLDELPPGPVIGTLYHLRELREAATVTPRHLYFVQVRVDAGPIEEIRSALSAEAPRLVLCGVDCESALAIASEVREAVGGDLEIDLAVGTEPAAALRDAGEGVPVLFSPLSWDGLSDEERAGGRAFAYRTRIPPPELESLGRIMGWPAH